MRPEWHERQVVEARGHEAERARGQRDERESKRVEGMRVE